MARHKDGFPADVDLVVLDDRFGRITLTGRVIEGWVEVRGDTVPTVRLERDAGARTDREVRMGSRDSRRLRLTVDGRRARVRAGRSGWTRRARRTRVFLPDRIVHLHPFSDTRSRLHRSRRVLGPLRLPRRPLGKIREEPHRRHEPAGRVATRWYRTAGRVTPLDAAVGYALVTAFGAGSETIVGLDLFDIGSGV
ncbi:hypothetical protein [Streptomyces spiramenti]|uniref:Uncharacterized protein n=1 Tax=Streptomyces spiramenti TaxID=2720606 RepID=A0ABX1AJT5_9ACTN|nr:hypothetical protein [Streptomyces spiramenti]NJP67387.1 hypothetical protein [Streptomyces spiramenti]